MKAAVMQPYLFPYIGYFQLINAVDTFVVYDDVNYIKKGWINRNSILVNGKPFLFVAGLKEVSQNKLINEITIDESSNWKKNTLKTIEHSYKKAPFFSAAFPVIRDIIAKDEKNLAKFITYSLREICNYLGIATHIMISSEIEKNNDLKGSDKIIEICKQIGAASYINPIGGKELYDSAAFSKSNIELNFIQSKPISYAQFKEEFIPSLSIIDVMMFNPVQDINSLLNGHDLL